MTNEASSTFHLSTIHRGRYMLLLLTSVFLIGPLLSRAPLAEVYKIIGALLLLPAALFAAIKLSPMPSVWTVDSGQLQIANKKQVRTFPLSNITHIRNLKRSGGNLILIYQKNGTTYRTWRNKLFEKEDDLPMLVQAIKTAGIEYYDM